MSQALAWVVTENCGGQRGDSILAEAELLLDRCVEPLKRVIEPLAETIEHCSHARFDAADGQVCEPLTGLQKLEARGAFQAVRLRGQMFGDLVLRLGDEFGCSGRCGRAQVGDKVGDGEVGFVSNRRNNRKAARCNGACNLLAVEGGQIFKRSAAAREHNEVDRPVRVQLGEGGFNFCGRGFALHGDGSR